MWRWLRKPRKPGTPPKSDDAFSENAPPRSDSGTYTGFRDIVGDMKRKGYQGPFVNICDGIPIFTLHGPNVSMDPAWVGLGDNTFQMSIVNCELFCTDSFLFAIGGDAQSIQGSFGVPEVDKNRLLNSVCDPHVVSCLLAYPRNAGEAADGPQAVAKSMEDLWHIFMFDGYFYFIRSWTGKLRHYAKVEFRDHAMFLTEVSTNCSADGNTANADIFSNDVTFGVRQVDFLIKTLLYNLPCRAPLPNSASTKAGTIALYVLTEYGRIGSFPTFDDTTEYRQCLNGTLGKFIANPGNSCLVNAISTVADNDNPDSRQRLHDELRNRTLLFAFQVSDEELQKGVITEDTPVHFTQRDWHGQLCFFAYTDITYRVEPSHGCHGIVGSELAAFVRHYGENACIVINPNGPATCKLELCELSSL